QTCALPISNFDSLHPMRSILMGGDRFVVDGAGEARPTRARIEFIGRTEQGFARDDVDVDPRLFMIPVFVFVRRFRLGELRDPILQIREALFQFRTHVSGATVRRACEYGYEKKTKTKELHETNGLHKNHSRTVAGISRSIRIFLDDPVASVRRDPARS